MNQTEVTFMQRAHRGDQPNGPVLFTTQLARQRHHALASVNDFHKKMVFGFRSLAFVLTKTKDRRPKTKSVITELF
jgi:hypothetical protein